MFSRYITPRIIKISRSSVDENSGRRVNGVGSQRTCVPELSNLIENFTKKNIPVFLVYHPSEDEILSDGSFVPKGGYSKIKDFAGLGGVRLYSLVSSYGESVQGGKYPFRDQYHPNPIGQGLIADYILGVLREDDLISQWSQRR